ncbi:carboxypeptidase-like regulatory domain-containing protein [Pseudomonas sp. BF-R-19]|uniref:carboxypeptidase-like regulatory domain-containing protein n=1 Tax=Pseudomonas sp. BF-R-19 TaxID=2832397 RepID=UPI001CBC305E|nr:carboxypeptidase-like regulatory domain-containing protein [Pseudomonas sp. BF-R-19]
MTAKPPNTSALTPDTLGEETATVTFDEIRDSSGTLVSENSVTFDPILELKGTAGANRALNIRDRFTVISDVTTGSSGNWIKKLDFQQGFKRYSLNAMEKEIPYDFSTQYIFVLATETPIIDTVTGKDGPIESGAAYDGDSLEFSGYAPPDMEVEALNGGIPTGKKATVDSNGLFKLTFDGLTAGAYSIKIRATNGKESGVFDFRVVLDVKLILYEVSDSQGVIAEGGTTYDDKVTVRGYARPGEDVQLRNNDAPIDGATATAQEDNGFWEIELEVPPRSYSLDAQALYDEGEISKPPYAFIVAEDVKLSLDDVADSAGLIPEGGKTYENKVTVSGHARPGRRVQLRNHDGHIAGAVTTAREDDGFWEIELDVSLGSYSLTVEALYGDGDISTPPRTFTVELGVELSLDDVADSKGSIPDGGTTYEDEVTVNGFARPGEEVQLLNNGNPINGATTTAGLDGAWEIVIDVIPDSYSLTAQAHGEVTDPPRTFTVAVDVELSLDDVLESEDGPSVPEDGTTDKNQLIIKGHARPGESIQLLNGGAPIKDAVATADPGDGAWKILLDVTDGAYSLAAEANYGDGDITAPPRTFTVASTIKPHNTRVYDSDGPIEDNGSTPYNHVIVRGDAKPSAGIKLKINGVTDPTPEPTDDKGKWARLVRNLKYETRYEFIAMADYGANAESNSWTITTGKQDVKPDIESVKDSKGTLVLSGSTTRDIHLTVSGKATPGQKVRLLKGTESQGEPEANGEGTWVQPITAFTEFVSLTAMALYGAGETSFPPYTFTVTPFGEITNIFDSKNTPILEGGYTTDTSLTFIGKASPNHTVEVWNGNQQMPGTTADEKGDWRRQYGLSLGLHGITIKVKDTESSPPRTFYVVANSELKIDRVTDDTGNPIPDNGSVSERRLIYFYGSGAYQNSELKLYVDDIFASRRLADEIGEYRIDIGELSKGGHRFQVKGANEQVSQTWYITIT